MKQKEGRRTAAFASNTSQMTGTENCHSGLAYPVRHLLKAGELHAGADWSVPKIDETVH